MVRTNVMRVDPEFEKIIKDMRRQRVKDGKDIEMQSSARITKAITRTADFTKIQKEIINAKFKEE